MLLLISFYKCVYVVFYANSKIVFQYIYHNVMLSSPETTQHMLVTPSGGGGGHLP